MTPPAQAACMAGDSWGSPHLHDAARGNHGWWRRASQGVSVLGVVAKELHQV